MNQHVGFVRNFIVASIFAVIVTTAPAFAATTKYLDFESTGSQSELSAKTVLKTGELKSTLVQISAFSFGAGKEGVVPKSSTATIGSATSGAGAGKVTAFPSSMDVTVGMESMQKLFDLAATGNPIPHVRLSIYKETGGSKIATYSAVLSDVRIVSLNWTGKGDKPTSQVTLDYRSIDVLKNAAADSTKTPDALTTVPTSWNRVNNVSELSSEIP